MVFGMGSPVRKKGVNFVQNKLLTSVSIGLWAKNKKESLQFPKFDFC